MRHLLKYLKGYEKESILGPLFKLLEASFELLVPLVVAGIIDVGILNRDSGYIWNMGGVLVLLGVVGLICSATAQYFAAKAAVGFGTGLRNALFCHINSLSYSQIDKVGVSTLITRMTSDINQVQSGVNMVLRLFSRSPFIVFGAMIMAFTINVKAAVIFVVMIPALAVIIFAVLLVSMPLFKKVQRQLDRVLLAARENLAGARVVRAFNRQQDEMDSFKQNQGLLMKFQIIVGKISALLNPLTYVVINLGILTVVWIGGNTVDQGIIAQGAVVALVNYMSQILVELIKLANLIITISKSLACANRVSLVFEYGREEESGAVRFCEAVSGAPKVEFCNVEFTYEGAKEPVLSGINIKVVAGQTIGMIGGTGSGKTTLVNLIPGFYRATGGAVKKDGIDVREYSSSALRDSIGIVPQKAVLFNGSLRENMRWGKTDASDKEILKALSIAQAREFVEESGAGLDMAILQGGKNLSGGQRQRLTIARALVRQPEILILDDSASALDYATDLKLRKAIKEETGEMTVFLVSQRVSTIRHADRILVLDDGQAAGWGSHEELLASCEVYREICMSQLPAKEVKQYEKA